MRHTSAGSSLCIGLLLPDVLGTYADRGNAVVLEQRARWRGLPVEVIEAPAGSTPPAGCDIYVLGGGEDAALEYAAGWLTRHRSLRQSLARAQVVAVCAGLQLLGRWMADSEGRRHPGAGVLDLTTTPGRRRAVGEIVVDGTAWGVGPVTGFENHRGRTCRGGDLAPLGPTLSGTGNGDGSDGAVTATVVGTYLHGPVLARNPALADLVLRRATGLGPLPPLRVPDEEGARHRHLHDRSRRRPAGQVLWPDRLRHRSSQPGSAPR